MSAIPNFIEIDETVCYSMRTHVMVDEYVEHTWLCNVQMCLESP